MALISCAECGREFSDKAAACPQCAAPIDVARADSKGASMPRFAHGGRLERRSHNEILIRAPGEQAFEHVRDALALMVDSLRVSTTPLSISVDVQVEKPPASAKIRALFEIPDSTTTLIKIEEMPGSSGSSMVAHNAIELVAKRIMEHAGESFHGTPYVSRNIGAKLNDLDTDTERESEPGQSHYGLSLGDLSPHLGGILMSALAGLGALILFSAPSGLMAGSSVDIYNCEDHVIKQCTRATRARYDCMFTNTSRVAANTGRMTVWYYDNNDIYVERDTPYHVAVAPGQTVYLQFLTPSSKKVTKAVICSIDPKSSIGRTLPLSKANK